MATSLELSLVRVHLLPLPFGGLFPFLVPFGDSHPPPFAQNSSFPSTEFRLPFHLLYVAVHVSFCILLRDSHTVPEAQTFPAAFYFPALVRTPTSPQPYCLFLPTQPSVCCLFPKPLPRFQAFAMPTSLTPISLSFCHSNRVLLIE